MLCMLQSKFLNLNDISNYILSVTYKKKGHLSQIFNRNTDL